MLIIFSLVACRNMNGLCEQCRMYVRRPFVISILLIIFNSQLLPTERFVVGWSTAQLYRSSLFATFESFCIYINQLILRYGIYLLQVTISLFNARSLRAPEERYVGRRRPLYLLWRVSLQYLCIDYLALRRNCT